MEFQSRFDRTLIQDGDMNTLIDAIAAWQSDVEKELTIALNSKHAPLAIPQVTIDSAHAQYNFAAADRTTILTSLALDQSASTTSSSLGTAVSYTGRGVLTMALLGEFTTAGIGAATGGIKITIDGTVIYNNASYIGRQSSMRVLVGSLVVANSAPNGLAVVSDSVGLPFNSSCLIEYVSDGTRTMTCAWKIAKKL